MMYGYSLDKEGKLWCLYFDLDGKVMKGNVIRYEHGDGVSIDFSNKKCYDYFKKVCKELKIKVMQGCLDYRGVINVDDYITLSTYCKMSLECIVL